MNQERVTRTTLPQVTVGMPLSLLKWVDEQAATSGISRSRWIVNLLEWTRENGIAHMTSQQGKDAAA